MRTSIFVAITAAIVSLLAEPTAHAQDRLPNRYQARPLTLPAGTLRPDFDLNHFSFHRPGPGRSHYIYTSAGLGIGVTRNFELGFTVLPLELYPDFGYLSPSGYGRARLLRGKVEIAFQVAATLPAPHEGWVEAGFPFLIHAGRVVRLDFGAYLASDFDDWLVLRLPFEIAFQVSHSFFFGFDTGVHLFPHRRVGHRVFYYAGDSARVPFGVFFGWTVMGRIDPVVDFTAGFRFLDVDAGFDAWQAHGAMRFYLYL